MDAGMDLKVIVSPKKVTLKKPAGHEALEMRREGGDQETATLNCYGVYGIIAVSHGSYLILVVDAVMRGMMYEHPVYEIKDVRVVGLEGVGVEMHEREVTNVKKFLGEAGIYFSKYPLYKTISIRKDEDGDFLFNSLPLERFLGNAGSLGPLLSVHCIQGFFGSADVGETCLRLISRRSWRRAGARYFSRGSDMQGYVSNYVETEQIVYDKEKTTSFLQVRGSIPLMWKHVLGMRYAPEIVVGSRKVLHVADRVLREKYGDIFYLSLIRTSGYEGVLHCAYKSELAEGNKRSGHFNFSEEGCILEGASRERFLDMIREALQSFGYRALESFQTGVIRTNCIDCLDRTNISQFVIGEVVLEKQLSHFSTADGEHLHQQLRRLWYDNGNSLSVQYSGSPALKSYFLRSKRQGIMDKLRDGSLGLKRYFINRLCHGTLQTTYEILTTNTGGRSMRPYKDRLWITKGSILFALIIASTAAWVSVGMSITTFLWSILVVLLTTAAMFLLFLDTLIQRPEAQSL